MLGHEQLATYLNDHLSGATAGRDLADKLASDNEGTGLGTFMSEVSTAIEEDRKSLEDVMGRAGVEKASVKAALGSLAEKAGRVRMHHRITGDPGLSRLLELEALIVGVNGKLALWRALREVAHADDRLADVDFDLLIDRAREQLRGLEERHRGVAAGALLVGEEG